MKNIFSTLTLLGFLLLFCGSSCKKHKHVKPVDQLPPATQEGKNTFGCLINGKVFVPRGNGSPNAPVLQCAYQHLHTNSSKGYFFQLFANDYSNYNNYRSIGISTDSLAIKEGTKYKLVTNDTSGFAYGLYIPPAPSPSQLAKAYYTNFNCPGELYITKYDSVAQIIAGTFSFTIVTERGDTIRITDGRFDMHYTR